MTTAINRTSPLLLCIFCVALTAAVEPAVVKDASAGIGVNVTTTTTKSAPTTANTNALPNTTQTPMLLVFDEPTARSQQADEGRAVTPINANELDGRSAYINNQYVADGETLPYNDTSPPLYQFLQEQMEHILGSNLPSETTANGAVGKEMSANGYDLPALQNNANSPVFAYGTTNFEEEDDMIGPYANEPDEKYYHGTAPTNPNSMELPKPIIVGATKVHGVSVRPKLRTTTTSTTTTTTEAPHLHTGGYGGQLTLPAPLSAAAISQQYKPQLTSNGYGTHMPSYKPQVTEEPYSVPSKYAYVRQNSTVHMRKRRITFKTVASASQIVSTPLADLMFKYSIGVAKPSMSVNGNSVYEQEEQPIRNFISSSYNDNLDLPKHTTYAGRISQSSHRKY
ncbi:uncharacterized protein LOC129242170 [Anastrepha obliqua]|uniref:uncharacterized protein LOC129242170 n=1 Tax=Anastrepha obliqua TaxID=95512 RepID=UPI00240A6C98|nr:uncharacterized protein LOC129242170 [Anastrepha obliqua]